MPTTACAAAHVHGGAAPLLWPKHAAHNTPATLCLQAQYGPRVVWFARRPCWQPHRAAWRQSKGNKQRQAMTKRQTQRHTWRFGQTTHPCTHIPDFAKGCLCKTDENNRVPPSLSIPAQPSRPHVSTPHTSISTPPAASLTCWSPRSAAPHVQTCALHTHAAAIAYTRRRDARCHATPPRQRRAATN